MGIKIKTFEAINTVKGFITKITYRDGLTPMSACFPMRLVSSSECKAEIEYRREMVKRNS